jgi:large subunit ribosomal protein L2
MSLSLKKKKKIKIYKNNLKKYKKTVKLKNLYINFFNKQRNKFLYKVNKDLVNTYIKKLYLKLKFISYNFINLKNYFYNYNVYDLLTLISKKPQTPGKRHLKLLVRNFILLKNFPLKSKIFLFRKSLGKNSKGQIVSYHHQVGLKRRPREVVKYRLNNIHQGIIEQIEYNPNHSALIARVYNSEINYHFYIRKPEGLKVGFYIKTNPDIKKEVLFSRFIIGDTYNLNKIIEGKSVNNLTLQGINNIARASGTFATVLQKYINYTLVRFPSKKTYYILTKTQATYGRISNLQQKLCVLGKAGRNRWLGKRPHVRGVAMNPIDHPHGGGQGRTSGGQPSVSPWGKPTKQIKKRKFFLFSKNKKKISIREKK